ncbi:DUF6519 domain-containing protein, partial [Candidatus Cyanaurora vandensis]|uniref:DUF6519 domain-containing protein n=1 Tax=Candidatus Cyanaurora vandensis TaxID=2714958 RepID=UPI00257FECF2
MGSDKARNTYNPAQHYRGLVAQQGRVTLEADWNEAQTLSHEELRLETRDLIGSTGTPDNGYVLLPPAPGDDPLDFQIGPGTLYVDGLRVVLPETIKYSAQSEWLDRASEPDWLTPDAPPAQELVYLYLREQEISATEDPDLREPALGGPDTMQRLRLIQRIARLNTQDDDCLQALAAPWLESGLAFDPATLRLNSYARLQVSFQTAPPPPDLCEPEAQGGYLGAENQLFRVQISDATHFIWGFDNASFLYCVEIDPANPQRLKLLSRPVDALHRPQTNQAVEVLLAAAQLSNGEYIAAPRGQVHTLTVPYDPDT